jgi:hypothetical protein
VRLADLQGLTLFRFLQVRLDARGGAEAPRV